MDEDVAKLVFLCVPGDGGARRPRKGMVPLIRGADWPTFCARAAKRLGVAAVADVYAWDGGPRIGSVAELLEVDEGRTLVVVPAESGPTSIAPPAHAVTSAAAAPTAPPAAPPTTPSATSIARAACSTGRRVASGTHGVAEGVGAVGAWGGASAAGAVVVEVGVDKYREKMQRRAAEAREASGAAEPRRGRRRHAPLSLRRIALLAGALCVLGTSSLLWLASARHGATVARIRAETESSSAALAARTRRRVRTRNTVRMA